MCQAAASAVIASMIVPVSAVITTSSAQAATLTTLYRFACVDTYCPDGFDPAAELMQARNGDFYGTTAGGGANGGNDYGTVFKITSSGALTTLYSFCSQAGCTDGAYPQGALIQATNGEFYGTASRGGANGYGTVFKINAGGTLTTLYSFCSQAGCTDGAVPVGGLIQGTGGDLYGATWQGGVEGDGTVFKISPTGELSMLYSFCSESNCTDGFAPNGGLIQAIDGDFYGATNGGGAHGQIGGTVFKITASGALTTLYSFCSQAGCADGAYPQAGLIQATDGDFYGTTGFGALYGTVFKITASGALTTLYSFCSEPKCADGYFSKAQLIQATNGALYGTTSNGGKFGYGTVFDVTLSGKLTTLYSFCSETDCTNGTYPSAGLLQATDGELYGTAADGNQDGSDGGTIFSLTTGLSPFVETQTNSGKVAASVVILGAI
jgi:uncharacterized repeat protein (TIGR03803 family)